MKKKTSKIDLSAEAEEGSKVGSVEIITDERLLELAPKEIAGLFKKAKTPAARADLLYQLDRNELKKARDAYNKIDKFVSKLEAWFVQEFRDDQRGVTGKYARVEIKSKEYGSVQDWDKFYKHIQKKGEFDLLNKAVNQRAVKERWEQRKEVPGLDKFTKKVVSLTQAKGVK